MWYKPLGSTQQTQQVTKGLLVTAPLGTFFWASFPHIGPASPLPVAPFSCTRSYLAGHPLLPKWSKLFLLSYTGQFRSFWVPTPKINSRSSFGISETSKPKSLTGPTFLKAVTINNNSCFSCTSVQACLIPLKSHFWNWSLCICLQSTLEQHGFNCTGPLRCGIFSINIQYCKCIFSSLWFS